MKTGAGSSVLCEAAEAGYDEILAKLLDLGADPDLARTVSNYTVLACTGKVPGYGGRGGALLQTI